MGASNALAAFRLYSAKVPPLAMSTLAYMALVSIDADAEPWFSLGAEMIAVMALGREPLVETGDEKEDAKARKAMEHACERALKPLFANGAITTARHSSGHPDRPRHAKYRLWLSVPAPDEKRDRRHRGDQAAPHGNRGVQNHGDLAVSDFPDDPASHGFRGAPDGGTPRNPYPRPMESVLAPHEIRGAKEYEEYEERSKNLKEHSLPSSDSVPVRAGEARNGPDHVMSVRVIASPLMALVPDEEKPRCRYTDCPGRAEAVDAGGYHPSTCAYLVAVKRPEAS